MRFCVFDIETDGLLDEVSKIHCLSYQIYENSKFITKGTITDYSKMINFLLAQENLVGHNIIRYDIPVLEMLLKVEIKSKLIDTLGISWYLFPMRKYHGLEYWGEEVGIPKPKIDNWKDLPIEEYIFRCEQDVDINSQIFLFFFSYLIELYTNLEDAIRLVSYLMFKMDCLRDQEIVKIPLNSILCKEHLADLEEEFRQKTVALSEAMPVILGTLIKTQPKVMFKNDGTLSVHGLNWITYLQENNLPETTKEVREKPNPGSEKQLKKWLFDLGWQPETYKVSKQTGKAVPKVSLDFGQGLCPSVKSLYEVEPTLELLDGYFKTKHRIGVFKSYLDNVNKDGLVVSTAHGFTNTLRLTHSKPIVNLPKPGVYYGKEIREVLTIPNEDYLMFGSDISGLEDNTKQHYIYFYDPEYVKQMRVPGFDPHVDIGVLAGLISKEEEDFFKEVEAMLEEEKKNLSPEELALLKVIKKQRGTAKSANFAATYGAGGPKIAETAKIPLKDGVKLHQIYWKRNWAVKKIAETCVVKKVNNQKWLYNPLSGFWLYLKAEKDRFSTLNQSSGVFVFDSWLQQVRQRLSLLDILVAMQYHDEIMGYFPKKYKEQVTKILSESMDIVNKNLKLNVEIGVSIDYGNNYAEVH